MLRLVPLFPFWLVNLVAGAVGLRLWVYLVGTFIGIIPGTFIYASLGRGLGTLVAAGRSPGLAILRQPGVLLPILGLAALSLEANFEMLDAPLKKVVVYLDPSEFKSTWLGNKAVYRTRMAMADGGDAAGDVSGFLAELQL